MRPRLKIALAFTAGLVVGAAVWGTIQMRNFEKFARHLEANALAQDALHLQILASEKRTGQWRELLFSGLPSAAQRLNTRRDDLEFAGALWSIRLAYSMTDRPVPEELESILANLPSEAAPQNNNARKRLGLPPLQAPEPATPVPGPEI
jgi:hypothetical protein